MTDERRERYAEALGPILEAFIKRPYITGARLDLADAAMAVADVEQHGLRATVDKQRGLLRERQREIQRLGDEIARLESSQTANAGTVPTDARRVVAQALDAFGAYLAMDREDTDLIEKAAEHAKSVILGY